VTRTLRRIGECRRCAHCCVSTGCSFLKGNECAIYDHRPLECRLFPRHPYELGYHEDCGYQFYDAVTDERVIPKRGYGQFSLKAHESMEIMGYKPLESDLNAELHGESDMSSQQLRMSDVCVVTLYGPDGKPKKKSLREQISEAFNTFIAELRKGSP